MPAIYAHDLFGKKVYEKASAHIQSIIDTYPDCFRIGLQGPDILFFYQPLKKHPINRLGNQLHQQKVSVFLEQVRPILDEKGLHSPEGAYILGFICHYMLDSTCHPYIEETIKKTGIGHIEIESEFEKMVMRKDGLDPITYPIGDFVIVSEEASKHIAPFYGLTTQDIFKALKSMRFYKNILVAKHLTKRLFLRFILKCSLQYDQLQGHLYKLKDHPQLIASVQKLFLLLCGTIEETAKQLDLFDHSMEDHLPFDQRLERNFE